MKTEGTSSKKIADEIKFEVMKLSTGSFIYFIISVS